jgi:SAM-dependent methyltransferase
MPIAYAFLAQSGGAKTKILDVGSPKLLPLCIAAEDLPAELFTTDISDYFQRDLDEIAEALKLSNLTTGVADARDLRYENNEFDTAFSVSVLEHIPEHGDKEASEEVSRVLKPGGRFVVTVPFKHRYMEEFQSGENFYWSEHSTSETSETGKTFYQRRYDWKSVRQRIVEPGGFKIRNWVLIGETPIQGVCRDLDSGLLRENWLLFEDLPRVKLMRGVGRILRLRSDQWIYSALSRKYHYFTHDTEDPQALCVALELVKS